MKTRYYCETDELDPLTGLLNKQTALQNLEEYEFEDDSLAVIRIDIDNLKLFNDMYGLAMGDKGVVMTANILQALETEKCLVSRISGEEFLCAVGVKSPQEALDLANEIRAQIANMNIRCLFGTDDRRLTVSCGISFVEPSQEQRLMAAIDRAGAALLQAKKKGGNTCSLVSFTGLT